MPSFATGRYPAPAGKLPKLKVRQDRQSAGKSGRAIVANLTRGRTLGYFYGFALQSVTARGQGVTHGHYPEHCSGHQLGDRNMGATIATMMFLIILVGVLLYLFMLRAGLIEQSLGDAGYSGADKGSDR